MTKKYNMEQCIKTWAAYYGKSEQELFRDLMDALNKDVNNCPRVTDKNGHTIFIKDGIT